MADSLEGKVAWRTASVISLKERGQHSSRKLPHVLEVNVGQGAGHLGRGGVRWALNRKTIVRMESSKSLQKTLNSRHAAEQNSCRAVSICQTPGKPGMTHKPVCRYGELLMSQSEPLYLAYLRERWLEEQEEAQDSGSSDEELNPLLLDPTQWKDQDHYAMLGLGKLRYRATAQDIKKACEYLVVFCECCTNQSPLPYMYRSAESADSSS